MTTSLNSAIVRIRAPDGIVVGTGFLVTSRHALTCARVVTAALGLPHDIPNPPQADLHLDFPAPGFSGGLTWGDVLGGVIGMIVAADTNEKVKAAFLIWLE
jgi:hypothetical protein